LRLVFVADVHHAFGRLRDVLDRTDADLYLVSGDLAARAFYRYDTAWHFMELQQILGGYRSRSGMDLTLDRVARKIVEGPEEGLIVSQAKAYLDLCRQAEAYLMKSYERLEAIFLDYPEKAVYALPGNYDMDLARTALKDRNLHLADIDMQGWKIAGYGGANLSTPGMPDHLQVPFREQATPDRTLSEALDFFRRTRPEILVLHQPAYGYLDRLPGKGSTGSPGIRTYVDEARVKVVLSGHNHDQWGAIVDHGTFFFNPSNFGRTTEIRRTRPGGHFMELILSDGGVQAATLRHLDKKRIYDVVDYTPEKTRIERLVLDERRYARLGGKTPKAGHIKPIRYLQRIKSFFLGYETKETWDLVNELRSVYRDIKKAGMEVAFDLLGSLSFGMAQANSDMDLVVYMRSRDCVLDEEDTCGVPRPLAAVFDALRARDLEIDVCDSLDLDRIRLAIEREDANDGQVQRFIFYRAVCRPVNLRLIKSVENELLQKGPFRRKVESGLRDYLEILVSSVRHISSFEKYKARLRERGIPISPDVEEAIKNYLKG